MPETVKVTVAFDPDTYQTLVAWAKKLDMSVETLVERLVERMLEV